MAECTWARRRHSFKHSFEGTLYLKLSGGRGLSVNYARAFLLI